MTTSENDILKHIKDTNRIIAIIGKKGGGKSYLLNAMLKFFLITGWYDEIHFVCPCYEFEENESYIFLKGLKNVYIYNKYSPMVSSIVMKKRKTGKRILYCLDDSTGDLSNSNAGGNDNELLRIFTMSRHLKIQLIVVLHSVNAILKPALRSNIDFIFIFRITNKRLLEIIHEEFLSLYDEYFKFRDFVKIYDKELNRVDYGAMVIDNVNDKRTFDINKWTIFQLNIYNNEKLKKLYHHKYI